MAPQNGPNHATNVHETHIQTARTSRKTTKRKKGTNINKRILKNIKFALQKDTTLITISQIMINYLFQMAEV